VSVAIIDYGAGNLRSAEKAFEHARAAVSVTADPDVVARADRVVLPGDGAFADCKRNLLGIDGMLEAIDEAVDGRGVPFLGICVGMQLLATRGIEHSITDGLDRIPGEVVPVVPNDASLKVPHMGWNTLVANAPHPLLEGIRLGPEGWHAFFLHGFHLVPDDATDVVAAADYGGPVTAIVARGNVAGTQFHPEKSQKLGLKLIENFLAWKP
jgi:glutamine amidotransferase